MTEDEKHAIANAVAKDIKARVGRGEFKGTGVWVLAKCAAFDALEAAEAKEGSAA